MKTNNDKPVDINTLISSLKSKDAKTYKISRVLFWIYLIYGISFAISIILGLTQELSIKILLSRFFYLLTFLTFTLAFRSKSLEYKDIDYSISTLKLMENAVKRYSFILRDSKFKWALLGIIFYDIGKCLPIYEHGLSVSGIIRILFIQSSFIYIIAFGLALGLIIWQIRNKPIRDHAQKIVDELKDK